MDWGWDGKNKILLIVGFIILFAIFYIAISDRDLRFLGWNQQVKTEMSKLSMLGAHVFVWRNSGCWLSAGKDWYEKAADQNDPRAQAKLGVIMQMVSG